MIVSITDHAYLRAKERLSLSRGAFEKMAEKAYISGIGRMETRGRFRKYVDGLWNRKADNIRIYGEVVYLFHRHVLITVFALPNEFKKYLKVCR
jgi:hypothetical protein